MGIYLKDQLLRLPKRKTMEKSLADDIEIAIDNSKYASISKTRMKAIFERVLNRISSNKTQ